MEIPFNTPLCVPLWEQREALEAGARYSDGDGFFAPKGGYLPDFWKWLPRMYDPDAPKPYLVPEMLPVTTWEQNIRHKLGTDAWDRMRKHAYRAAGFRCEICGANGRLEAHESWTFANETCVQKLTRIIALCTLCHKSHHTGIARRLGLWGEVRAHMKHVNGWGDRELELAVADAYEIWEQRHAWPWTVDLSWLQEQGYLYV